MISEVSRTVFLDLLSDYSPRQVGWSAVCVFIPPEQVHDRCHDAAQEMIDKAQAVLRDVPLEGLFARIGWMVFFVLAKGDGTQLCRRIETVTCPGDETVRWHGSARPIGTDTDDLAKLFGTLEVAAHEAARLESAG